MKVLSYIATAVASFAAGMVVYKFASSKSGQVFGLGAQTTPTSTTDQWQAIFPLVQQHFMTNADPKLLTPSAISGMEKIFLKNYSFADGLDFYNILSKYDEKNKVGYGITDAENSRLGKYLDLLHFKSLTK